MLISEQILLLSTNDEGKHESAFLWNDMLLRSGLLADLMSRGLATITERKLRDPIVAPSVPAAQVEDPVLRTAVEALEKRSSKTTYDVLWSEWFGKRQDVAQRLVAEGILEESGGGFRLFSRNQFPTRDGMPELQLRGRLEQILRGQAQPTEQDATLIMLLDIYDAIRPLLKEELRGIGRGEVKRAVENASASVASPEIAQTLKAAKKSVEMAAVGATMTVFTP